MAPKSLYILHSTTLSPKIILIRKKKVTKSGYSTTDIAEASIKDPSGRIETTLFQTIDSRKNTRLKGIKSSLIQLRIPKTWEEREKSLQLLLKF